MDTAKKLTDFYEALEGPMERLVERCNNAGDLLNNTEEVIAAEAALEKLHRARLSTPAAANANFDALERAAFEAAGVADAAALHQASAPEPEPVALTDEREAFEARFAHLKRYPEVTPEVRQWMWSAWEARAASQPQTTANSVIAAAARALPEEVKELLRVGGGLTTFLGEQQCASSVIRKGLVEDVQRWEKALRDFYAWLRAALAASQPAPVEAQAVPEDPMDWRLPCDVTVGHGTMRKGVALRTLVMRMKVLYEMATGRNADEVAAGRLTIDQEAELKMFRDAAARGFKFEKDSHDYLSLHNGPGRLMQATQMLVRTTSPAPSESEALKAAMWDHCMDLGTRDFAICKRVGATGACWEPIKTSGPVEAAVARNAALSASGQKGEPT